MITVKFFAMTREQVGADSLTLDVAPRSTSALKAELSQRGPEWEKALATTLVAVNQTMSANDEPLSEGDEVAFFPPVTGG